MNVSVVIPVYNRVTRISRTFDTLKHTLNNLTMSYEILICDDASTDGSLSAIEKVVYGQAHTIVLEHRNHLGFGKTLRELMEKAKGEIIVYLDIAEKFDYQLFPILLNKVLNEHIAITRRVIDKKRVRKEKFFNKIIKIWHKVTLKVPVQELDPPLAVFRKEDLKQFDLKASGRDIFIEIF